MGKFITDYRRHNFISAEKCLVSDPNWPAPKRNSVFYSMSQKERISLLSQSSWPNLNWSSEWVKISSEDSFDRQIAVDSRSQALQKAFGIDKNQRDE